MKYEDYRWDFIGENTKEYTHGYHTYPAMMIPQIARTLLEEFSDENTKLLFDPYVGSGTSLVEAKLKKINSIGTDLNPLARLISKTKTEKIPINFLMSEIYNYKKNFINSNNYKNTSPKIQVFSIIDTWFKENVKIELGYINTFINNIINQNVKDFFLVAFSETIRKVSFTRQSEFKLYRISEEKRNFFSPETFNIMLDKLENNLKSYKESAFFLEDENISAKIYDFNTVEEIPRDIISPKSVDIVITSPPYGDSRTTVAYGQFSRLSNEWLGYNNAVKVDKKLMGGEKTKKFHLFNFLPLDNVLLKLHELNKNRAMEIINFYDDYLNSIRNISKVVKIDGIVAYVVGNRRVCNIELPTDEVTRNFFERNGFVHLKTIIRNIPNKRLPLKTIPSNKKNGEKINTMTKEYIVILKKNCHYS